MRSIILFRNSTLLFLCIFIAAPLIFAQNSPSVQFRTQIGGWPDHACIIGDHAYLIQAMQISVLDISEEPIRKVGSVLLDQEPTRIYNLGGYIAVFTAFSDSGLQIFNIYNPESPVLISKLALPVERQIDFRQNGAVFYVVTGDYFYVLNLTNPSSPSINKTLSVQSGQCVEVNDNYIYVGTEDSLVIYEGYDNPVWKKSLPFLSIRDMAACSFMLYLGIDEDENKQLVALNLMDPLNPVQTSIDEPSHKEGFVTWIKNPQFLAVQYPTLYLGCEGGDACLMTYDISNIYQPVKQGYLKLGDQTYVQVQSLYINEDFAYMTTGSSWALAKIDVSNPANPVLSDVYRDIHTVQCFAGVKDTLYASSGSTLFMYDISDTENPVLISSSDRFGGMFRMTAESGYLYGVKQDSFCILDVRDPEHILLAGHVSFNGNQIQGVEVRNRIAFVSVYIQNEDGQLAIINVSDRTHPVILKNYILPGFGHGTLYASDDGKKVLAGFFKNTGGIQILDMTDPSHPQALGSCPTSGIPIAVTCMDTLIFAASNSSGFQWFLESFSIKNLSDIKRLGIRTGEGTICDVKILEGLVTASIQGSIEPSENTDSPVRFQMARESGEQYSMLLKEAGSTGSGSGGLFFFDPFNLGNLLYMLEIVFALLLAIILYAISPIVIIGLGHMTTDNLSIWGSLGLILLALIFGGPGVVDTAQQPISFELGNYPNPFNPETTIQFTVKEPCHVKLEVFDLRGKLVATPVDEFRAQGVHSVRFDAQALPSGIYTTRLDIGGIREARKIMLVR